MSDEISKTSEFATLYASGQSRLLAFICSLVGSYDTACDILQETNVVMWEKQSEFEIGTNFTAWSFRIARYQVMAMREKASRDRLVFSQNLMDLMAEEAASFNGHHDSRQQALTQCLEQLPKSQGDLIRQRYMQNQTVAEISNKLNCSTNAISIRLHRIRTALSECIERQLKCVEGGQV